MQHSSVSDAFLTIASVRFGDSNVQGRTLREQARRFRALERHRSLITSPHVRTGRGGSHPLPLPGPHLLIPYVQLQRQSSALALAYGIPHLYRVSHEGRLHPPGLPPLRLHQIPNHHDRWEGKNSDSGLLTFIQQPLHQYASGPSVSYLAPLKAGQTGSLLQRR
jgi:hypothetical protein